MISDEKKKEERSIMYDQETCLYNFQENTKKEKNQISSNTKWKG